MSGDDEALSLSTWLAGDVDRAGRLTAKDARTVASAERYNLQVVDLTGVDDGSGNHHSKYSKSAAVVEAIGLGLKSNGAGGSLLQAGSVTEFANNGNQLTTGATTAAATTANASTPATH